MHPVMHATTFWIPKKRFYFWNIRLTLSHWMDRKMKASFTFLKNTRGASRPLESLSRVVGCRDQSCYGALNEMYYSGNTVRKVWKLKRSLFMVSCSFFQVVYIRTSKWLPIGEQPAQFRMWRVRNVCYERSTSNKSLSIEVNHFIPRFKKYILPTF